MKNWQIKRDKGEKVSKVREIEEKGKIWEKFRR